MAYSSKRFFRGRPMQITTIYLFTCALSILFFKSVWHCHPNLRINATPVSGVRSAPHLHTEDENVFLPADDVTLKQMNKNELWKMYWKYINTLQVLCRNQIRLGSVKDGGKEICLDEIYKPRRPCLVYSFGHQVRNRAIPTGINFHLTGLWNSSETNAYGWEMNTLDGVRKNLNHEKRVIDILKIDIESAEWSALPQMFQSGVLKYVKQMCIEIHFVSRKLRSVTFAQKLKVLRTLYEHGFHIFMHEHNLFSVKNFMDPYPVITTANEISLINVNWKDVS